ncbi:AAA family ATPase [Embleya sp. NPDC008237]|uniref:helix-turn-helix transcriptional regulator n=1 Tax=Embleya sp. NPDC008237 TaxID=3363978 RepID=UPI0036F0A1AB
MLLVERNQENNRLDGLLAGDDSGRFVVAVISGSTGMEKTDLLRAFRKRAAAAGVTVLSARSSPECRDRPYSTVRELLDSAVLGVLTASSARISAPPDAADPGPAQAAGELIRTVSELSAHGPVLVAVDDIEYADPSSLRCLRHLAQHPAANPVAVVLTWDRKLGRRAHPALEELLYCPSVRHIRIGPLSSYGGAPVISELITGTPDHQLAQVHLEPSVENPSTLGVILTGMDTANGGPAETKGAPNSPAESTETIFRDALVTCLHRLGPIAVTIARGVALLDECTDIHLLSRFGNVSTMTAGSALRKLAEIGFVRDFRFRHEAARSAVLDDIPPHEAVRLRHRASRLLREEGAPAEAVAAHLLVAGPLRQDWVVPVLLDASQAALLAGRTSTAIHCLELAAECCTDEARRYVVEVRAAGLQWLREPAGSRDRFLALGSPPREGKPTLGPAMSVAEGLLWHLRFDEALDLVDRFDTRDRLPAARPTVGSAVPRTRLLVASTYPGLVSRLPGPAAAEAPQSGAVTPATSAPGHRAVHALSAVLTGGADEHTIAQAEQVLQDGGFAHGSYRVIAPALLSLVYADLIDSAAVWCTRFLTGAGSHETPGWQGVLGTIGALVSFREGRLDIAVDKARAALAHIKGSTWNESSVLATATLAEAYTAIGNHEAAAREFARPAPGDLFETRAGLHYLYARGRHRLATGRARAALADFTDCGARMTRWGIDTATLAPWRAGAVEASLALGDDAGAARWAEQKASPSGIALPRARGIELRSLAATRPVGDRPGLLEEALQLLQHSGDRYQSAHALADLGEAYQVLGDRAKARTAARRARRIAESCHAELLCRRLVSTHPSTAKPNDAQGPPTEGDRFAILSDSERRVAILAAQGYANREISDRLHVTISTVEQHLTRVYRKMSIRNREELPTEFRIGASTDG